jgi:hypothetical protein
MAGGLRMTSTCALGFGGVFAASAIMQASESSRAAGLAPGPEGHRSTLRYLREDATGVGPHIITANCSAYCQPAPMGSALRSLVRAGGMN